MSNAGTCQECIAFLHLVDSPSKNRFGFSHVDYHRMHQMRQASVAAKLHHLWVDHQHADFVRSPSHQYRRDDRVQTHTLTGTGSASDQQVWQARQVYRQGLTRNVFTEEQRNLLLPDLRTALFDHFTHADDLTFFIRHFDSNTVLARDRCDNANARNTQRYRQIIC